MLLGAVLLRLPLLPLPPTLSDDLLRYVWDGRVAAAGRNPYVLAPSAAELTPLRDESWQRMPHRDVETVYPPLALAAFSIASRFPRAPLAWKLFATGADLLACSLLAALASRLSLPPGRAAWYAWNPLVILEVAGMGHVDALGAAATIAVVLGLVSASGGRRPVRGIASLAAAGVLTKLVPLVALPLWARRSGRPWAFLGLVLALVALASAPVLAACGGLPPGLGKYAISWEFNGPLFEPLWRTLDHLGAAPAAARFVDRLKDWTHDYRSWNAVYPYLYPQLLAKALLAVGLGGAVLLSLRERDPVAGTERILGAALLASATVYPWYLLWVLPFAALRKNAAWLALSGLILLSYLPQFTRIPLMPWVFLGIWGPFFGLLLWTALRGPHPLSPSPIALPPARERGELAAEGNDGSRRKKGKLATESEDRSGRAKRGPDSHVPLSSFAGEGARGRGPTDDSERRSGASAAPVRNTSPLSREGGRAMGEGARG